MEKNNNKLVIVLLVIIICLMLGGGFLALTLFKDNSNTNVNLGESNSVNNKLDGGDTAKSLVVYNEKNVPQVNLDEASEFNKKVSKYYGDATEASDEVTFASVIKDGILFCSIEFSYLAGMGGDFEAESFVYDLNNQMVMKNKDILSKFNINVSALNIDEYEKEWLSGENSDNIYYIMPSANGFLKAYPTGMGPSIIDL